MAKFEIVAWWTTQRGARKEVDLAAVADAVQLGSRLAADDGFIEHNEEFDNSDGPTVVDVFDAAGQLVAQVLPPSVAKEYAAETVYKALKELYGAIGERIDTFMGGSLVQQRQGAELAAVLNQARAAIEEAERLVRITEPEKAKT